MASESVAVLGEVAAERRPKLDAMLLAKKPGLTPLDIKGRRVRGMDAFYKSVWAARHEVRMSHPRDVDDEDVKLRVDHHVWMSLLDEEEDGEFPWAGVKPPRSHPSKGYASWFWENAPRFSYPPEEARTQLWAELLGQAPYDAECGPFEVLLPAFAWPLVSRAILHSLLADLPAAIRIATKPVDESSPGGILNVAMGLKGPMEMEMASKLQVARMKSDLVRCFMILRLWAQKLARGDDKVSLPDFFVSAYQVDVERTAALFGGYSRPASPGSSGFVEGELASPDPASPQPASRQLALRPRPSTTPAQQHVQPSSAGPSTGASTASESSRGGSVSGGPSRGESSRGGRDGAEEAEERRVDLTPRMRMAPWAEDAIQGDMAIRLRRNQEAKEREQELKAKGKQREEAAPSSEEKVPGGDDE